MKWSGVLAGITPAPEGSVCTRCKKEPRAGTTEKTHPLERTWCKRCRGSARSRSKRVQAGGKHTMVPPLTPGGLCSKCKKRPQASVWRSKAASTPRAALSLCGPCRVEFKRKVGLIPKRRR